MVRTAVSLWCLPELFYYERVLLWGRMEVLHMTDWSQNSSHNSLILERLSCKAACFHGGLRVSRSGVSACSAEVTQ